MKKICLIVLALLLLLSTGCSSPVPEESLPGTEPVPILASSSTSSPTVPETQAPGSGQDRYQALQWLDQLRADQVDYIEFVNLGDPLLPYRRYEGEEIPEVVRLLQGKTCPDYTPLLEYAPIVQWPGYYSKEFHLVMKDGTAHTVCSVYSTITVIDGTGFKTISAWLNNQWPESGSEALPADWAETAAARKYHISEDTISTHSTQFSEDSRFALDQSYDTDPLFGSLSRHYPIGRGGIELSASAAAATGVSLNACWSGTGIAARLRVQPRFWLEAWQEEAGCYQPLAQGQFTADTPQQLAADTSRSWYLSWVDTGIRLQPGHYRVGMTFYEEYNGSIQNETVCYAKFAITDAG